MAKMIAGDELSEAVRSQSFIKNGTESHIEGVKYDFSLSNHILKAEFGQPINASELGASERRKLQIEPGEVVFVLSEETLELPDDIVAHLSPKRKISHLGIITLGGLTIDPGYKGPLVVGLFNLAGTPFSLIPGKKLIAATFQRLENDEKVGFRQAASVLSGFPDELLHMMQKYQPVAMQSIINQLNNVSTDLTTLKSEIRSHDMWYKEFERISSDHEKKIGELLQGLTTEKESRQKGEDKLSDLIAKIDEKIVPINSSLTFLRGAAWVIGTLVALAAIPILIALILKWTGVNP